MGQSKAERDAAIRKIKETVAAKFVEDGVRPDEVVLRNDGKVVVDRRSTYPRAVPVVVGEWS